MTRIAWLCDFTDEEVTGGAELTGRYLVEYGRKLGHEIEYVTAENFQEKLFSGFDLVIVNNNRRFPVKWLKYFLITRKFIKFEHDYGHSSTLSPDPRELAARMSFYRWMYDQAREIVLVSPLHKEVTLKTGMKVERAHVIMPYVPGDVFRPLGRERQKNSAVYVGALTGFKGARNLIEYARRRPGFIIHQYGPGSDLCLPPNIIQHGFVDQGALAEAYNRCEYLIHLPVGYEPFGRCVLEAILCGCGLIVNRSVGALSFKLADSGFDYRKENENSRSKFWNTVEAHAEAEQPV